MFTILWSELQACAKSGVTKALQNCSGDAFKSIAQLLSGRQIAAAAVVAASAGNVRLASLIAQVCPCFLTSLACALVFSPYSESSYSNTLM